MAQSDVIVFIFVAEKTPNKGKPFETMIYICGTTVAINTL
jgi:hypothetical protein